MEALATQAEFSYGEGVNIMLRMQPQGRLFAESVKG